MIHSFIHSFDRLADLLIECIHRTHRPLDLESGVVQVTGQLLVNSQAVSPPTDLTALFDWRVFPTSTVPDGSDVRFVLTTTNAAGLTTVTAIDQLVDSSPAVCLGVQYVVDPGFENVVMADEDGNVTVTAQNECWDPESGIVGLTMLIGYVGPVLLRCVHQYAACTSHSHTRILDPSFVEPARIQAAGTSWLCAWTSSQARP